MAPAPKFYVTTPIFYPNGAPHIGHAYTALASDVIARFERADGRDVFFLSGTDEHGLKMKQTAIAEGVTPIELADRNSQRFRDLLSALQVSQDDFIRTTEPRHAAACQAIWERMQAAGDIYLGTYAGWYSVRQEAYFDEGETTVGLDGVRREPLGSPVEWTEEQTHFFRLSAYEDRLLAHYEANPDFILPPERRNEVASFVRGGLQDLSISRAGLDWGVPVPGAPEHVMYVWVDALTNYITALGYPYVETDPGAHQVPPPRPSPQGGGRSGTETFAADATRLPPPMGGADIGTTRPPPLAGGDRGGGTPTAAEQVSEATDGKPSGRWAYWPASVHVIGKDIVRFHAVYWPAFLMSAGLALPERVFAHGFLYNRGEKMSKSVGNVVDPFDLVAAFGVDPVRYFFLREVAFGQDGSYGHEAIVNRINADLANDLGNLAQRSLSMIAKNCDGRVPEPGAFTPADEAILAAADGMYARARECMDRQAVTRYLDAVWAVVADANRYFAGEEPWAKKKTDPERMDTILYVTAEVVRQVAILAQPVMPSSANTLLDLLAIPEAARAFAHLGAADRLKPGVALPEPQGVFPRYVEAETVGASQDPPGQAKPKGKAKAAKAN